MTMTRSPWNKRCFITALLLGAMAPGWLCAAVSELPFEAVYEVRVDGKMRLETRISLAESGGTWTHESVSKGVRGLARMLGADSLEVSTGTFRDGRFVPFEFLHRSKIAGRDSIWNARFDWPSGQVVTRHEEGESVLPLAMPTDDPMSLTLAIRNHLSSGGGDVELDVLREEKIDRQLYRPGEPEQVQTPLGCFEAVPVERVRDPESKRYSSAWYAPSVAWMPVQIRHGKRGGKDFLMRLTRLVLDGEEVSPPESCPGGT